MKNPIMLLIAAAIPGCAVYEYTPEDHIRAHGPEPTQQELTRAHASLVNCLINTAPVLDDRSSDATTVGAAVADACSRQAREYVRLKTYSYTDTMRRDFEAGWPEGLERLGRTAVLKNRAAKLKD